MTRFERIYEIFEEHWGEERIDWDDSCRKFTIWYPEVTISNENNDSTIIKDLYIRFYLNDDCLITNEILVTRTTFTEAQWQSKYIHSHVPSWNSADKWKTPCFGTSPLSRTVHLLRTEYNEVSWELFVDQLDSFTEIESLHGGPYKKIRDINSGVSGTKIASPDMILNSYEDHLTLPIKYYYAFIYWLIKHCPEEITVSDNIYTFARTDYDLVVWMSAEYCKWYNAFRKINFDPDVLKDSSILIPCCKVDGIYYDQQEYENNYSNEYVLTFRGERKRLNIISDTSHAIVAYILRQNFVVQVCLLFSAISSLAYSCKPLPDDLKCIALL